MKKTSIPNILTMSRIVLVPVFVVVYYCRGMEILAAVIFAIAALTDLFDGMLARRFECVTNFGKLIDPVADKLLVTSALLVLLGDGRISAVVCIILIGRDFIMSAVRIIGASANVIIAAGNAGKIKTVAQLVGLTIMLAGDIKIAGVEAGLSLIYISALLSIYSCIEYIYKNRSLFK